MQGSRSQGGPHGCWAGRPSLTGMFSTFGLVEPKHLDCGAGKACCYLSQMQLLRVYVQQQIESGNPFWTATISPLWLRPLAPSSCRPWVLSISCSPPVSFSSLKWTLPHRTLARQLGSAVIKILPYQEQGRRPHLWQWPLLCLSSAPGMLLITETCSTLTTWRLAQV